MKNKVTDPQKIAEHARKVRSYARLFAACGEYSLAADLFDKAAELYQAAGKNNEAEDARASSDENAVTSMDRVLRLAAQAELEPGGAFEVLRPAVDDVLAENHAQRTVEGL